MHLTTEVRQTIEDELRIRQRQVEGSISGGGYTSSELRAAWTDRLARIDRALAAIEQPDGEEWEPFDILDDDIETEHGTVFVDVIGGQIRMRFANMPKPFMLWNLKDGVRLCRRTPAPQALDAPDGPGHWAYWHEDIRRLLHFDVVRQVDNIIIHGDNSNNRGLVHEFLSVFKEEYPGKFYRLTMPWDATPAPQPTSQQPVERDGWCDSCGDTIMVNEACDSCGAPATDERAAPQPTQED